MGKSTLWIQQSPWISKGCCIQRPSWQSNRRDHCGVCLAHKSLFSENSSPRWFAESQMGLWKPCFRHSSAIPWNPATSQWLSPGARLSQSETRLGNWELWPRGWSLDVRPLVWKVYELENRVHSHSLVSEEARSRESCLAKTAQWKASAE